MYSFRLNSPSPAELLVAVSIALFASVLFLWIMDATGLLPFRAAWISKAVYGAAITSILGTSVAVYKDFFYAVLRLHFGDGSQQVVQWPLSVEKKGKFLKSREPSSQLSIELRRPA